MRLPSGRLFYCGDQMSITSYSELKTAVADYAHRTDLTSKIPDFIVSAESRINRLLSMAKMETDASLSMTPDSRYVAYPSDMGQPIALWLETYLPRWEIIYKTPTELPVTSNVAAPPNYYTVDGSNLAFDYKADQAHSLTFRYVKKLSLSDSVTTNAILEEYPDIYLYGSLVECAKYTRDMDLLNLSQQVFNTAIEEANDAEARVYSNAKLSTEIPVGGNTFNINRGY